MIFDKAVAYHGAKEQVGEENWRENRDQWMKPNLVAWLDMPLWWINATDYYSIDQYVQYEKLIYGDTTAASQIMAKLAALLQEAGFSVAPRDDWLCIWYSTIKKERKRLKSFYRYTPGYTVEQRRLIMKAYNDFIAEHQQLLGAKSPDLLRILSDYSEEVRESVMIDEPYETSRGA